MAMLRLICSPTFVLLICVHGFGQPCGLNSITSKYTFNGRVVEGLPEWDVEISNTCECPQSNVVVKCRGFATYLPVDPSILNILQGDDYCLVNSGKPILQGHPVKFNVVLRNPTDLFPFSSDITC